MRDLLRADLDMLNVLCARAADYNSSQRGVSVLPLVIEKDFWATEILCTLSTPQHIPAPNDNTFQVRQNGRRSTTWSGKLLGSW
jgi:hypothetical protein